MARRAANAGDRNAFRNSSVALRKHQCAKSESKKHCERTAHTGVGQVEKWADGASRHEASILIMITALPVYAVMSMFTTRD